MDNGHPLVGLQPVRAPSILLFVPFCWLTFESRRGVVALAGDDLARLLFFKRTACLLPLACRPLVHIQQQLEQLVVLLGNLLQDSLVLALHHLFAEIELLLLQHLVLKILTLLILV